jgi:hypothetical protein
VRDLLLESLLIVKICKNNFARNIERAKQQNQNLNCKNESLTQDNA